MLLSYQKNSGHIIYLFYCAAGDADDFYAVAEGDGKDVYIHWNGAALEDENIVNITLYWCDNTIQRPMCDSVSTTLTLQLSNMLLASFLD